MLSSIARRARGQFYRILVVQGRWGVIIILRVRALVVSWYSPSVLFNTMCLRLRPRPCGGRCRHGSSPCSPANLLRSSRPRQRRPGDSRGLVVRVSRSSCWRRASRCGPCRRDWIPSRQAEKHRRVRRRRGALGGAQRGLPSLDARRGSKDEDAAQVHHVLEHAVLAVPNNHACRVVADEVDVSVRWRSPVGSPREAARLKLVRSMALAGSGQKLCARFMASRGVLAGAWVWPLCVNASVCAGRKSFKKAPSLH